MGNFSTNSFPNNRWVSSDTLSDLAEAIQSVDAAIRHAFGFSVNTLTAPFDIADDGSIVVQTSIAIGTSNAMIDVVDEIPASPGANEDQKLAHVEAIRNFLDIERIAGANVDLNTSNFNNNLSSADDTAQKAFDTIDNLDLQNLFHYDEANEFATNLTAGNLLSTSYVIFEDPANSYAKYYCTMQSVIDLVTPASHTHVHADLTSLGADDHTQYLLADGTRALTGDWDAGAYNIIAGWGGALQVDVGVGETPTDAVQGNSFGVVFGDSGTLNQFTGSSHTFDSDVTVDTDLTVDGSIYVDRIRDTATAAGVNLEQVEFVLGEVFLKNAHPLKAYEFDGITDREMIYMTSSDEIFVGDGANDVFLRGAQTRPEYIRVSDPAVDLALYSDVEGVGDTVYVRQDGTTPLTGEWDMGTESIYTTGSVGGTTVYGDYLSADLSIICNGYMLIDTINERQTNFGVTIEGVVLKDDNLDTVVDIDASGTITGHEFTVDAAGSGVKTNYVNEYTVGGGVFVDNMQIKDSEPYTDQINEKSIGAGVTVDGLLIKDGAIPAYVPRNEWLQNGFPDSTEVDMDWDDGSMTLTIQPVSGSFNYYHDGVLYTETGSITETITDTEGLWVIYIDGEGSMASVNSPSDSQIENVILNECIVAYVYWDATSNDGRLMNELHGASMSPATHHYLHDALGAYYKSGLTVADVVADGNGTSDTHAQFSITAGTFYDEDFEHATLARNSTDTWEYYYTDGSGNTRWGNCESTFPVYAIGGVIAYNNGGTMTAIASQKFCLYHVFATNIKTDANGNYYPIVVPGETQYDTKAEAQDAAETEVVSLTTGNWPVEETIPIATVIFQRKATASNGVTAAIVSTAGGDDYIDWRGSSISGSGGTPTDHGALSGLTDDDHTQYIRHALATAANDFLVASGSGTFVKKTLAETGAILEGDINHNNLVGYVANRHIDWTAASAGTIHTDNYIEGGAGTDTTAIHDDTAGEINAITVKSSPSGYDLVVIEDYGASWAKKKVEVGDLGVWSVTVYDDGIATTLGTVADNKSTTYIAVGQILVYNNTGSTVSKGDVCYINGDSSGTPTIALADADAASTGTKELVIIKDSSISNSSSGYALKWGLLSGLSGLTANTVYYLSTTAGDYTTTAPSGSGDIVRVIGYSRTTTELLFQPDGAWVEVS